MMCVLLEIGWDMVFDGMFYGYDVFVGVYI